MKGGVAAEDEYAGVALIQLHEFGEDSLKLRWCQTMLHLVEAIVNDEKTAVAIEGGEGVEMIARDAMLAGEYLAQ